MWSTYLGGSGGTDEGRSVAIDSTNRVIVAGYTGLPDFPTRNVFDSSFNNGSSDVFVSTFSSNGSLI